MGVLEASHLALKVVFLRVDPRAVRQSEIRVFLCLIARLALGPRLGVLQHVSEPGEAAELIDAGELDEVGGADLTIGGGEPQEELGAHRLGEHTVGKVFREPVARLQHMERRKAEQ